MKFRQSPCGFGTINVSLSLWSEGAKHLFFITFGVFLADGIADDLGTGTSGSLAANVQLSDGFLVHSHAKHVVLCRTVEF